MFQVPVKQLKEAILKDGVVSEEAFTNAETEAKRRGISVDKILIGENLVTPNYLYDVLAGIYKVPRANLLLEKVDEDTLRLLSEYLAKQKRAVLFREEKDGSLDVAMEDPSDLETVEFLTKYLGKKINPFLASDEDLQKGFSFYGRRLTEEFKKVIEDNIRASLESKVRGEKESAAELPIVAIVDNLLSYAFSLGASDVHIEVLEDDILVRYRVDGILQEVIRMSKDVHPAIVARLKILSALKLDEHYKPQDGRFRHKVGDDLMDIRVAIMPTFYGEKVEMRLLPAVQKPLSLEELGMLPDTVNLIRESLTKTYGMILICGPTGSGKTTTLYSIMNILNRPEINIISIEDPIEYNIKYINQTQINPAAGIAFANGLRAIVRQDPNVVMVGEIRDTETADIAVQSSLTGHLILSSLHTNDAPTAIPRLIDMNIQPFLISAVLNVVAAQRLVRKICTQCIASYETHADLGSVIKSQLGEFHKGDVRLPKVLYRGKGCPACGHTGYKGRTGIFEVLMVNETIRALITSPTFSLDALHAFAAKEGMIAMFEDGLRKAEKGITTIEELLRVIRE